MEILIMRARKKDPDSFVKLMDMNMQTMYKVGRAYLKNDDDIADAIQDTILTCYEKMNTLRESKYFKTWLVRILINKCNDILKRNKVIRVTDEVPDDGFWDGDFSNLEWSELLECLDEKYRTILLLYYLEGFNTKEIAQLLDMNEKTVQTRLARGRSKFTDIYMAEVK